jgi:hypothetical protein
MKVDEQHGRRQNDPQQSIAMIRTEYRIRGDAGRIIIGEPSEQPGPEYCQKGSQGPGAGGAKPGESARNAATVMCHGMGRCVRKLALVTRVFLDVADAAQSSLVPLAMRAHAPASRSNERNC